MPSSSSELQARYPGWALVTGASSGIGQGFAEALAARGFDVVLVARGEPRLRVAAKELSDRHGVATRVVVQDLAAPGAARKLFDAVADLEVGILVNNAGTGWIGRFELAPPESHASLIALHCTTPVARARRIAASLWAATWAGRTLPKRSPRNSSNGRTSQGW